jgi:hypothetical protein
MSVDRTGVKSATFTFAAKPELLVGGKKQPFENMSVNGKTIQGVRLKDGSLARLSQRQDGKWNVTLTASQGKDLSKRTIHIGEGGRISRLRTAEGERFKLKNNQELLSGRTIKLNEKWVKELTKNLDPISPKIEFRTPEAPKKKDDRQDDIVLTERPPTLRRRNALPRLDKDTVQIQIPKPEGQGIPKKVKEKQD